MVIIIIAFFTIIKEKGTSTGSELTNKANVLTCSEYNDDM